MIHNAIETIKTNFKFKKLLIYMIRWQLSSPVLAGVMYIYTGTSESFASAIIANFVGSLIFYWIDLITFLSGTLSHQWEIKEQITCHDCKMTNVRGYRLVIAPKYNRMKHEPQFRCESCSQLKVNKLRKAGLKI